MKIAWKHTAEELMELYKREGDGTLARRWQALWLLRRGERLISVKKVSGAAAQPITAFAAKAHMIDNKAILEVSVPPQPEKRPLRALEEDGRWWAYVRIDDQTRLAGSFLEAFWEAQKNPNTSASAKKKNAF